MTIETYALAFIESSTNYEYRSVPEMQEWKSFYCDNQFSIYDNEKKNCKNRRFLEQRIFWKQE